MKLQYEWLIGIALGMCIAACASEDGDTDSEDSASGESDGDADGDTDGDADAGDPGDPWPEDSRIIYLHHSTGGVIWGGGVAEGVETYNTENGTSYSIEERSYPNDPYPWNNYPYDYYNIWVANAGDEPFNEQDTLEILTADYNVVMFKHCYPVSGVGEDTGSPDITSSTKSIENYMLQYEALKTKLHTFPDTRFIVWTGAALIESATSPENAERARTFFEWVIDTWDEPGDNIFVWDFLQLETEGGLYLLPEYSSGDSHPNDTFAAQVAPLFVNRLVDVLEGRGDTGSVTGE